MATETKKKRSRGKKVLLIILIAVGVIIAGTIAAGVVMARRAVNAISAVSIQSAEAERGTITQTIDGSGNLEAAEVQGVLVPVGVTVDEVQVQAGDTVQQGDVLATLDTASIAGAVADVDESLKSVKDSLSKSGISSYEREELTAKRDDLQAIRDELVALHDNPVITATADGIIGGVGVSDGGEITSSTSASSSSASTSSAADSSAVSGVQGAYMAYHKGSSPVQAVFLSESAPVPEEVPAGGDNSETDENPGNEEESKASGGSDSEDESESGGEEVIPQPVNNTISKFSQFAEEVANQPWSGTQSFDTDTFSGEVMWEETDTGYIAEAVLYPHENYIFSSITAKTVLPKVQQNAVWPSGLIIENDTIEVTEEGYLHFFMTFDAEDPEDEQASAEIDTSDLTTAADYSSYFSSGSDYSAVSGVTGETVSGNYSTREAEAFTIILTENVKLKINVDELDILSVKEGQTAVISIDAADGAEYEGTIERVSSTASGSSGSAKYTAEILIPMDANMRIGMSASASIITGEAADVLTLPMEALQESDGETFVYTAVDDNGLPCEPATVTVGMADGTTAEITSGLNEGDTVYYTRTLTDDDMYEEYYF